MERFEFPLKPLKPIRPTIQRREKTFVDTLDEFEKLHTDVFGIPVDKKINKNK